MDGNNSRPKTRTVKPDGEACKNERLRRGWDIAAMAAKTGLTTKTVESVENGNPCYVLTLDAFRAAFELPDLTPLLAPPQFIPPPVINGKGVPVRIKLRLPFPECDFTGWLIRWINKLIRFIDPQGGIEVVGLQPGSVIITLEMEPPDAHKLVAAFGSGELDAFEIASIATDFGGGEILEFEAIQKSAVDPVPTSPPQPPSAPTAAPKPEPQKSALQRLSNWLFGEPSDKPKPYKDSYSDSHETIFSRRKQELQ